jgi:uncharacterized protein YecT (DUF1311 family)
MKIATLTVLALGFISIISPAQADPTSECNNQAANQVEVGNCLAKVAANVDAVIDFTLELATGAAKELDQVTERTEAIPALTNAQAAWNTYRDTHCAFVGTTFGGGSGTGIAIRSCRIELGRQRITELMNFTQ